MFPRFNPEPEHYDVFIQRNTTEYFIQLPEILYHPEFEPYGEIESICDAPIIYENGHLKLSNFEDMIEHKRYKVELKV